ncbi:DinB family protein [bacterium]|nr:MAG: DinB family protein [bacterium]
MASPQTPLELIAGQLDWANTNINNNLDFIPDDKLDWKPAPEAKSVLEIINHAAATVNMFTLVAAGKPQTQLVPVTNREDAKALVTQIVGAHKEAIKNLDPSELGKMVELPIGPAPLSMVAGIPVVELVNHHGQITYIQTLLGDTQSHLVLG